MLKIERFEIGDKFGYKNEYGEVVLPVEYDYVPREIDFNKTDVVIKNRKAGLVNHEGSLIAGCIYDDVIPLSETLYAARINNLDSWSFGVFNIDGKTIVEFGNYTFIERNGDYLICYKASYSSESKVTGKLYDYTQKSESEWLDFEGHIVYSGKAECCINDCIIIKEKGLYGFVNRLGKIVKSPIFSEISNGVLGQLCVKQNGADGEYWNVITIAGEIVINEPFSRITIEGCFYKCLKDNQSDSPIWINAKGKQIFIGPAKKLADTYLAVFNGDHWGVVNNNGKKILTYSYDSISSIKDAIIVLKNNKIGLVGWNGELIIEPAYNCIEFTNFHDRIYDRYTLGAHLKVYGQYCSEFVFDTNNTNDNDSNNILLRSKIYVREGEIRTLNIKHIVFSNPIVLKSEDYQEIFTLEEGTLSSSRYDEIQPITNISYVVKSEERYGVYRCDTKELIVGIEYNRIQYMGNHTVLLEKDGFCGAKSLVLTNHPSYKFLKVEIPCQYLDIRPIDNNENIFSVKVDYRDFNGISQTKYSLITRLNYDLLRHCPASYHHFESHFYKVGDQRYLTKSNEKYGFIHQSGYISLPFKFDEILKRDDGHTFDVRIKDSWGIITLEGKEIVAIKYSKKIPQSYAFAEVTDASSGCKGILGEDGNELLPTVYDTIVRLPLERVPRWELPEKLSDYYAVGFGGWKSESSSNFFCEHNMGNIWGVVNKNNELLVRVHYDCIKIVDGYFLCGRDGRYLYEDDGDLSYEYADEYDGEYDVIDFNGNFIIGGCSDFHYNKQYELYFLKFGGQWNNECTYAEDNIICYEWVYHKSNSRWLVLDKDLNSIIPKKDGSTYKFPPCFLGKITTKKDEKGQTIHYWNMPLELFSIDKPEIKDGIMFYGEEEKRMAIRLRDKCLFGAFYALEYVGNSVYYYQYRANNEMYVGIGYFIQEGIQNNSSLVQQEHYILLTKPVKGFCFAVTQNNNLCDVYLANVKEPNQKPIKAISAIEQSDLFDAIAKGKLLLTINDGCENTTGLYLVDKTLFDESFIEATSKIVMYQAGVPNEVPNYWYSYYKVEEKKLYYPRIGYPGWNHYSLRDSLMDALDGDPDAYWNID